MTQALFPLDPVMIAEQSRARGAQRPDVGSQWRLAEIQLANWGTFDEQIYRIPVAYQGHLITGPSGSGKSSLLDGIAAVLTPDKWLRFNVAAQTAGSRTDQRSLVSYVRGAWTRTADAEHDRVVSKYLRPGATWSGILLRYENGTDKPLSLVRLFFLKGSSTSTSDLSDVCMLERSALDLNDLQNYARSGLETRKIKADHPDAIVTSNGSHARFYARMRSIFGMGSDAALQLLHKTQSAKSLDSLDRLFRDYMLESPRTFELADTAVQQFVDLKDAHDHVVQLRLQRDQLLQLKIAVEKYDEAEQDVQRTSLLSASLRPFQKRWERDLLTADTAARARELVELDAEDQRTRRAVDAAKDEHARAHRMTQDAGGSEVEHLQQRVDHAERLHRDVEYRWETLRGQLQQAGIEQAPTTAAEFAELQAQVAPSDDTAGLQQGPSHQDQERLSSARTRVRGIESEIAGLRRSGTSVPEYLLQIREQLVQATGISESALPFAAEIISVKETEAQWTGAIERVLRSFALTMLVRQEHLATVRTWVDANRIRGRLVYEQIATKPASPRPARSATSLVNKVTVVESGFGDWVRWALAERFDVACVMTPDELDHHDRAVTVQGQLKTSRTRYEKDDRRRIDDRSQWVLGDSEAKLEALIVELKEAQAELDEAEAIVDDAQRKVNQENWRQGLLSSVRQQSWSDLDRDAAAETVEQLRQQLLELSDSDGDLARALVAEKEAAAALKAAEDAQREAEYASRSAREQLDTLQAQLTQRNDAIRAGKVADVDPEVAERLEKRFRALQRSVRRESLPDLAQQVAETLQSEHGRAQSASSHAAQSVTRLAVEFKATWASVASELTAGVEDRGEYLRILDEIQAHGLPEHEERFKELLQQRSRDLIGELLNEILATPREVEDRVAPINASLQRSQFDQDRYLRLKVKTRRSETVNAFMANLRDIASGNWGDEDLETSEQKYRILAEVMRRFASSEHVDRVWKNQCLDTRLHVSFLAEEIDDNGRAHATYDSGAAMSGGQQQKLVIFCLAAALRYQLADPDEAISRYGTIILDEAFDKADTRYTRMALDIFVEFGFHMVLATPQKLLQTIEPYVGGATSIENPSRQKSLSSTIMWADRGDDDSSDENQERAE
ncbi:ATP-binding protein [Citricoccus muralis]|uniref:ATP-binding protein n=1 Tax=Citricoccus muralis TaxID=169134 RepID=A0ABY8H6P4_9MICC|nr:SbcC/MukB-like Walker B domain-containing protein [Citricoccus muralis]WFP16375.1 ATP-binding protein [Citricoccus muralis]